MSEVHETRRGAAIGEEEMPDDEVTVPMSDKSSEITPIETTLESEKKTSSKEENKGNEDEPCYSKTTKLEETPTSPVVAQPEKVAKSKKLTGTFKRSNPREQPNRKRRATQRYGIDMIMAIGEDRGDS